MSADYKYIGRIGPKYKIVGINEKLAGFGQIREVFENELNSLLPIEGYEKPKPAPAQQTTETASPNVKPSTQTVYPSDSRLESIMATSAGEDSTYIIRKPFNSDQMTTGTGGMMDAATAKKPQNQKENNVNGVPAIMNKFAIVNLKGAYNDPNDKMFSLIDAQGKRKWYEDYNFGNTDNPQLNDTGYSKDVTVSKLIAMGYANKRGTTPYSYSDFAYCKYFKKIPNNYLITLRRYAVPTFDSLDFPFFKNKELPKKARDKSGTITKNQETYNTAMKAEQDRIPDVDYSSQAPPVAQAVTWMGDATKNLLDDITKFSVGLTWKELKSDVWTNDENASDASGLPGWMGGIARSLSVFSGEGTAGGTLRTNPPPDPYADGPYANRILGAVNRLDKVQMRDAPLDFKQEISLNFHYTARSIGGINTKAAMLDIISNFLLLTYGTGAFWGGATRFTGTASSYPWKKGMAAWYSGEPVKFGNAILDTVSDIGSNISSIFENLMKGGNFMDTLKSVAKGMGGMAMRSKIKGQAPMFHGMRSLLTGEPTGAWHLVIGNPLNPIMMIGNLIVDGCEFKFNNELGPDDFPTELTVTITLKHAMPRDRYGVESMFNKGAGRIYTLPDGFEEKWSGNVESKVDKYTGENNPFLNKISWQHRGKSSTNLFDNNDVNQLGNNTLKTWSGVLDKGTTVAARIEMGYSNSKEN